MEGLGSRKRPARLSENELKFPQIDIVYTWVNGSDKEWLASKKLSHNVFLRAVTNKTNITEDEIYEDSVTDNGDNRYRSHDELRFSLRSILKFAPWANMIHIVVADDKRQVPSWLNTSHPKINVVTHADIFVNKSYLPTFNTNAIESQLDNIPGLTEYYLYFNDDMFLGNDVTPYDFLTSKLIGQQIRYDEGWPARVLCNPGCKFEKIKDNVCHEECNVSSCGFDYGDCGVEEMKRSKAQVKEQLRSTIKTFHAGKAGFWDLAKYVDGVFNRGLRVKREPRNLIMHTPYFINRRMMKDLKQRFFDEYDVTASHKFRHPEDMQLSFAYFYYLESVRAFAPTSFQAWHAAFQTIGNPEHIFLYKKLPSDWDEVETQLYYNVTNSTDYQILKRCSHAFANEICTYSTIENCTDYLKSFSLNKGFEEKITATYCQNTMNKLVPKLRLPIYDDVTGSKKDVQFRILEGDDDFDMDQLQTTYLQRKKFITINDDMSDEGAPGVEEAIACMYKAFLPDPSPFEIPGINSTAVCGHLKMEEFMKKRRTEPPRRQNLLRVHPELRRDPNRSPFLHPELRYQQNQHSSVDRKHSNGLRNNFNTYGNRPKHKIVNVKKTGGKTIFKAHGYKPKQIFVGDWDPNRI